MTLQHIKEELQAVQGLSVSERGTGKGQFLFIHTSKRAIEVYIEDVVYIVEYWDSADEQADDAAVGRDVIASDSEAVDKIKRWLAVANSSMT